MTDDAVHERYLLVFGGRGPAWGDARRHIGWIPLDLESYDRLLKSGVEPVVPDVLFDCDNCNRIALSVYEALLAACTDCAEILEGEGQPKHLNLAAVFFHECMRLLCGIGFRHFELMNIHARYSPELCMGGSGLLRASHPFGYAFLLGGAEQWKAPRSSEGAGLRETLRRWRMALRSVRCPFARRQREVLCSLPGEVSSSDLRQALGRGGSGCWILTPVRQRPLLYVPALDEQLEALYACIRPVLPRGMAYRTPGDEGVVEAAILRHIEGMVRAMTSRAPTSVRRPAALFTGTLSNIKTRLEAAQCKASGVPVVTLLHGESFGALDEPIFGYGESSFADVLVGYGEVGIGCARKGRYSAPLLGEVPTYLPSSSDGVRGLRVGTSIPALASLRSPCVMYVPTSFSEEGRYGPYRDLHDIGYMEWQRGLLSALAEAFGGRVVWKQHPKSSVQASTVPSGVEVASSPFGVLMNRADVFVFDYLSTAFALAAATSKPILFLDLGLRRLTPEGAAAVRDRCLYVEADPRRPSAAIRSALVQSERGCVDAFTDRFSLSEDGRPRIEVVAEALRARVLAG